ncbi:E3 ubiquitin-protein ligase TRIM71 isoform X2 [Solenopsis invicta]|nr:E3 ubiquitin-protein ligase TRIM71 isoform X2 [Solenopsis invicta]
MNQLKSPRNRIDYNRHSMQLTNKSRKQDDQHFTPRKFTNSKKGRSYPDSSPDHFLKQFPPGKLSQQEFKDNALNRSILNRDSLNEYPKLHSQSSMLGSSLSCSSESRSCSSDDNLTTYSPVHQLDGSPDDHFEYFRMFEDASGTDVPGPNFSAASYRNESCQPNYETFEDLNMNLLKFDLLDDISRRQSPAREECSPSVEGDVINESFVTLMTKELEKDESDINILSREQRTRSPSSQRDSSDFPLISELEVANEIKNENSGQQSPANERWSQNLNMEEDTSSAITTVNKEEAKDTIEDRSLDQTMKIMASPYECNDHPCAQMSYCQTCCKIICKECATQCVCKHVTVDLVEFLDITQRQAEEVLMEAYLGVDVLADDMESMGLDIAALDQRTREALTDVKFFSRRLWSAVEEREKKLFKQIVETRRWKYEVLHEKYMNLKEDKTRLSQAINALKCAIHDAQSSSACNPDDLLQRKDMVLAEIWQIRQSRKTKIRSVRDDNWISFRNPDNNVLSVIANGGNILVNGPGTIGDRLPNRDYKISQSYFPYGISEHMMQSIPRGRPIVNYDRSVCLPNRLPELQVKSTDVTILGYFGENNPDNLCRPWGLTCDHEGNIIISDRSNNRIQIYREDGTLIRKFGCYGNGPCQFNRPAGIAVDARRRLIVVDKDNHRVQILTTEGEFLRSFGEHGEKQGQFCYPWDVAVNSVCEIAVTDTRNHRVQLFSPEGIPLRMFGGQAHQLRYLDSPRGICFNPEGKLVVTDFNNHHVLIIEYNMTESRILKCEKESKCRRQDGENNDGQNDENTPTFQRPQGVIAADDGSILVADSRHNSIKAFNSLGSLLYSYKPGQEEMDRPLGIALHWDGRMTFTDYGRNYVRLVKLENHVNPMPRNNIMFG